jgi:hypothetical protein
MPNGWIRRRQVLLRLKKVIAKHKRGYEPSDIKALYTLKGKRSSSPPGLGFTSNSVKQLTMSINEAFSDVGVRMRNTEVDNPKVARVRDLAGAIWRKVPERHREE